MKDTIRNLKFTWNYVKKEKKSFIITVIMEILYIILSIILPIISANAIVKLTNSEFQQLLYIGLIIFLIENLYNVIYYCIRKYGQIIYRETLIRLQYDLGSSMLKLDNNVIDKNGSGVFIQRITNDTSRLSDIFSLVSESLMQIITNIGIFGALFIINKIIFTFMLLQIVIIYCIEHFRTKKFQENDKIYRKESEGVSGFISEMIRGIRDVKMLNSEDSFLESMREKVYKQNLAKYNANNTNRKFQWLRGATRDLFDFLLIALMVVMLINEKLTIPAALIIHNYSGKLPSLVNYLGNMLDKIKDFNLSASRIIDIIDSEEFSKEHFGNKHLKKVNGDFEFKNVHFSYGGSNLEVLKNLSFKVNANETVAFVGKSGAGKSTIFSLLCKMYDIDSGVITIDGIDIKELDKDSIRGNITIISQNPYIFNLSIKDNLKLVKKNVTNKEIKEACHLACLDDFIESLPDKYDTIVGEGGVTLSGGQRQRLAIARALIQKTEIILFDEATSALDNETQEKIQKAIENMQGEYTILIIAHRLSTIMNADRILLVENGKIKAEGTHRELLNSNRTYKKLYESELKSK